MSIETRSTIRFSPRVLQIEVSPTLLVMNKAMELISQGVDVVDFGPGEPDFKTPETICFAAKKAIDDGRTRYTNSLGTLELRDSIASRYNDKYGTTLTANNIIAGTGGKQELFNLILALVSEGDEVVIPSPYWVSFPDQVSFAGGVPVFARTEPAENFRARFESIRKVVTDKTRGIILNSPCNPTGAVIERDQLGAIVELCAERGLFLIFDETYELFVYGDRRHNSAMEWFDRYPETVIIVNSMSKTFAMTGWRLGYAVADQKIIAAVGKIQSHSTSNPSSISQAAAVEAFKSTGAAVAKMFEAYAARRDWLIPALNSIPGFVCPPPDGAFYAFPDVSSYYGRGEIHDSTSLSQFLLDEARVAVVPGFAFGEDLHIRISYATSMDRLHEGVRRMTAALAKLS